MLTQPTQEERNRLAWQSRRGMLELDVLLVPFTENVYVTLSPELRASYAELLACEDADLFRWFMGKAQPEAPHLAELVAMIVQHARASAPAC